MFFLSRKFSAIHELGACGVYTVACVHKRFLLLTTNVCIIYESGSGLEKWYIT